MVVVGSTKDVISVTLKVKLVISECRIMFSCCIRKSSNVMYSTGGGRVWDGSSPLLSRTSKLPYQPNMSALTL